MSKQKDLASRIVSNTEENRIPEFDPQIKRKMNAELELQLSRLNCRSCDTTGNWKIVKTGKIIRYVKCGACGKTSAISINGPVTRTLRSMDIAKLEAGKES